MMEMDIIEHWLTYKCYEYNRIRSPHIPVLSWRKIFPEAELLEEIFEKNITNKNEEKYVLPTSTL